VAAIRGEKGQQTDGKAFAERDLKKKGDMIGVSKREGQNAFVLTREKNQKGGGPKIGGEGCRILTKRVLGLTPIKKPPQGKGNTSGPGQGGKNTTERREKNLSRAFVVNIPIGNREPEYK